MILQRIRVRRFRAISDGRIIEFSPGLNIIKGSNNESGKSSLRMAITKGLFQDPDATREDVVGLTSWGAREPWEIELDFECEGGEYRVMRSLKARSSQIVDTRSSRVIANDKNAVAAKITEFTGCPSEVFFESIACIGQEDLIRIVPGRTTAGERQKAIATISRRLQEHVSNAGSEDVRLILEELSSKTRRREAGSPHWHLERINERMESLNRQKAELEGKVKLVMDNRRKLSSLKEQLARIDSKLPAAEALLSKANKLADLEADLETSRKKHDNFKQAQEIQTELERMDRELKGFARLIDAADKRARISEIRTEGERLAIEQSHLESDLEIISMGRPLVWPLLLGTVLLIAGAAVVPVFETYSVGIPVAMVGILLLAYGAERRLAWRRQLRQARASLLEGEAAIRRNERALQEVLGQLGFQDYEEYVRQLGACDHQIDRRNELARRLKDITGDRSWSEFELENRDLDLRISAMQKEMNELAGLRMSHPQLRELEAEVDQLCRQRAEVEAARAGLERSLEAAEVDSEELAAISEELSWREQEARFWERKGRVYEIVRETLEEVYNETVSKAARALDRELGNYISIITDGRYSRVEVDNRDLSISTYSAESGESVSVQDLSRATQDQFYVSARLALLKLVTGGKKPPLLLDDPFVNYDDKRRKRMMGLLQQLAGDNQILLFTSSDAYDAYGYVISLG
ncbi:MAG: AAA family ATPase [Dehalococcoidia bacterium]|nr:AAA family ATPase [Dehalococcoidia bacterium]